MKEISVQELKAKMDAGEDYQLIDIREPHEFDIANLDGELIPMGEIFDKIDQIATDKDVVIHCRSGKRSAAVIQELESRHNFSNLYNLAGGVLAWADEIDNTMEKY